MRSDDPGGHGIKGAKWILGHPWKQRLNVTTTRRHSDGEWGSLSRAESTFTSEAHRDLAVDWSVFKPWRLGGEEVMKMENEVHKKENNEMRQWSVLTDLSPPRGWKRSETLTGRNKKWGKRNCWTKTMSQRLLSRFPSVAWWSQQHRLGYSRTWGYCEVICLNHRWALEERRSPEKAPWPLPHWPSSGKSTGTDALLWWSLLIGLL